MDEDPQLPPEPPNKDAYKERTSVARSAAVARRSRRRNQDGSPRPTTKLNVDPYYLSRLKARFIASKDTVTIEELAVEMADYMNCDGARALNYLKMIASGEGWRKARENYWERLQERALAAQAQRTIEAFETEMTLLGRRMVEKAEQALMVLEPRDVTEAVLLLKLGQDTTYRAHRVPAKISRYLNTSDDARSAERRLQNAPRDEYAAAVQSDLAALTAEVGADPAAGRGDGRSPDR